MPHILLWVVFSPVYLGEYASLEACHAAKTKVATMAIAGNSAATSAAYASIGAKPPPLTLADYDKIMACVPNG